MGREQPELWPTDWTTVAVPGWESHRIEVRAGIVNGLPVLMGVRIQPTRTDVSIPAARLRSFPAAQVAAAVCVALADSPDEVELPTDPPHHVRAKATVAQVAAVWSAAYMAGLPAPREAVTTRLGITARTADRYIARARERGLLPPGVHQHANGPKKAVAMRTTPAARTTRPATGSEHE